MSMISDFPIPLQKVSQEIKCVIIFKQNFAFLFKSPEFE